MIVKGFLVVRSDGSTRTVHRRPKLSMDEFAFTYTVTLPDAWGRVIGDINIEVPETVVPDITVEVDE